MIEIVETKGTHETLFMKKYSFETNKQRSVVYKFKHGADIVSLRILPCRAGSGDGVLAVCFYAFRVCNTNRTLRNERCGESERKFPNVRLQAV